MKFRLSIMIGYITMFLWLWMLNELYKTELSEMVTQVVPSIGLFLTMGLIYRLERMAKELKNKHSADSSPGEAPDNQRPNEA